MLIFHLNGANPRISLMKSVNIFWNHPPAWLYEERTVEPEQEHEDVSFKSLVSSGRAGLRKGWAQLRLPVMVKSWNHIARKACYGFCLLVCFCFSFVIVLHRLFNHKQNGDMIIKKEIGSLCDMTRASSPRVLLCSSTYYKDLIISQRHRWNTFFPH